MENVDENILKAINMVVENVVAATDKKAALTESVKFFSTEIVDLSDNDFKISIKQLKSALEEKVPELTDGVNSLSKESRKLIAWAINDNKNVFATKRDILIKAITDYEPPETDIVKSPKM